MNLTCTRAITSLMFALILGYGIIDCGCAGTAAAQPPSSADFYFNRGTDHLLKGENDEAIADLTTCIERKGNDYDAFAQRGAAYANKGDYDKALADFNRGIELKPDEVRLYENRGLIYDKKGDYDRALADFNKCIELQHRLL